jgi:hypothetical protein
VARDLFLSEDECEMVQQPKLAKQKKRSRCASAERSEPSTASSSTAGKKCIEEPAQTPVLKRRKTTIPPISPVMKPRSADLFGSDSDDNILENSDVRKGTPIYSYITRRLANGTSRQSDDNKKGTHYVELKVYSCDEIDKVQPMNRWRHSVVTIKNRTDNHTEAWAHLAKFISATRKEFKDCPPSFNSTYY